MSATSAWALTRDRRPRLQGEARTTCCIGAPGASRLWHDHEFVGRTPVVTQTRALDEDDLVSILIEPKNAVVRQYRKMFQLEDVDA